MRRDTQRPLAIASLVKRVRRPQASALNHFVNRAFALVPRGWAGGAVHLASAGYRFLHKLWGEHTRHALFAATDLELSPVDSDHCTGRLNSAKVYNAGR